MLAQGVADDPLVSPAHQMTTHRRPNWPTGTRGGRAALAQTWYSSFRSGFLLWDGTNTGWVVVTSGASLPLARVAWLGFVCSGELPEILDLFLQLDHLEFTPNNQPLELL
jgi:hypothetical protein